MKNKTKMNSVFRVKRNSATRPKDKVDKCYPKECTVCRIQCNTDKQYIEHFWSLTHHIKVDQVEKGISHPCIICKKTYETIKEYGDHLALQKHREARGRFYDELGKGKTVMDLVKSNLIITPQLQVDHAETNACSPKGYSKENRYANNNRGIESQFTEDTYFDYSFNPRTRPPSFGPVDGSYDNYPYYGQQNYDQSHFYQNTQYFQHNNYWSSSSLYHEKNNRPNYWQDSNACKNSYEVNINERIPHNKENASQSESRYPRRDYEKYKARSIRTDLVTAKISNSYQHDGSIPNKKDSFNKNSKNYENHCDVEENQKTTLDVVTRDADKNYKISNSVDENLTVTQSPRVPDEAPYCKKNSEDQQDSFGSEKTEECILPCSLDANVNSTPDRVQVLDAGRVLNSNSPNPRKLTDTPDKKKEMVKENISKLVNLSCSRKQKLLLQTLIKEYGRAQTRTAVNRLGQSLLSLVEESLAADVASSLSSAESPSHSNQTTAEQLDSAHLPDELLGQIMEFLTENNLYTTHQQNDKKSDANGSPFNKNDKFDTTDVNYCDRLKTVPAQSSKDNTILLSNIEVRANSAEDIIVLTVNSKSETESKALEPNSEYHVSDEDCVQVENENDDIQIIDEDFETGKANYIKKEVFDEIIFEGEKVLRLNEVKAANVEQVGEALKSDMPSNQSSELNTRSKNILPSPISVPDPLTFAFDSSLLITPSSIAVHALDLAIEHENIQSQIQVLFKQITKMQTLLSTLQGRAHQVELQRSELMKHLSKSVEGRKQAANLNRIISEIPTEPLCANINSSNSRLPKEVNSSAQIRRLGNELAQESSVVTVPIELPRTNANDSLSRGQGEMTGEVAAFQRASPPTSKSKKRLRTKSGGDNDVSEKRKKKQGVTVNLQPDESPITNNSSKENSSKKEKKKKHKKKKSDENQIEKIVGPSTSGLSSSSNSASSQLIEKRGKKDVLNFCGHVGSIIQLIGTTKMLYTCSSDGTVKKFKIKGTNCKCLTTFIHQSNKIIAMEVINNKGEIPNCLVTASNEGVIKKFDLETGECLASFKTEEKITCLTYHWGCIFIGFCDGSLTRIAVKNLKELGVFQCSNQSLTCLTTAVEGAYRIVCVGSEDGTITIREAHSGLLLRHFNLEKEYPLKTHVVKSISFTLGSGNKRNNTVYMHNFSNGQLLCSVNPLTNITCMHITNDHQLLLGCSDGLIRIMDPKTKQLKQLYYGAGRRAITAITCWQDLLISGNDEGKIEGCKIFLKHNHICKYGKCPGKFAYYDDLAFHVKHAHVSSASLKCVISGCKYSFMGLNTNAETIAQHILSHSSFVLESE